MITLERTAAIPADRRLVLVIEVSAAPEADALRRVLSRKFPAIDELKAGAARKARKLRDEWPD